MAQRRNRDRQGAGRRDFLRSLGQGAAALALSGCAGSGTRPAIGRSGRAPNVVIIFTDDQGYQDVGCYGAEGFETPHLDGMAAEGVRFTDFYAVAPTCTPSRAALMTGCYARRVGLPAVLFPQSDTGLNADEVTLAELLRSRGYATACVGKWHLGHHPEFLPTRHGFDEYFGLPYSNDMLPHPSRPQPYPDLPLIEGETVIETNPDQSQLTRRYTERAVDFIRRHHERPFFLYLPHSMPHIPLFVSEPFRGVSQQGMYGDVIMEIDWSVGEVLRALREYGVDDHTLVIFTSDNGPWLVYGDHGGAAGPLREGKGTTFEGGQRVPCIMRWPERLPAGKVCGEMCAMFDLYPTIAGLAGAATPNDRVIDGRDIRALMECIPGARTPHDAFFYFRDAKLQAVRSGRWKLHLPHKYRSVEEAGSGGAGGRQVEREIGPALFDLEADIGERNDLAAREPEIVERLTRHARAFEAELAANSRPPGKVTAS